MARRMVIIGAGPMGLEAALGGLERGFDVRVLEAGRVGESMRRWGPTRLFTPMSMNLSERAFRALGEDAPDPDALLTGPEMAEQVLAPLVSRPPLAGRVRIGSRVVSVARRRLSRHDHAGHPIRQERPFRLLVDTEDTEEDLEADVVLDASGVYGQPLPTGLGGLALGERAASSRILRTLGEIHNRRPDLVGRKLALVGDGHSAANAILTLRDWVEGGDGPRSVTWITRTRREHPCVEIPADPLPERLEVTRVANGLAGEPPAWLSMHRNASVRRIGHLARGSEPRSGRGAPGSARGEETDRKAGSLVLGLSSGDTLEAELILSLTGYRPDLGMLQELALDIAPATEGAGPLWRAVSNITDCLSVPKVRPADLSSGEPGFYMIGAKSYGRSQTFLLSTGRAQLETILDMVA